MIGARALQGLGAALLPPTALSILAVTFDDGPERNRALGVYGAVTGISASTGVIASGLLTSGPGWRWVFFINVPIGVILIVLAAVFLSADAPGPRRGGRFDGAGGVLSFIFLGSLLMQQVLGYSPTRTGVAWLATTAVSFVAAAAAVTGAKLAAVAGVRRLLVAGRRRPRWPAWRPGCSKPCGRWPGPSP